MTFANLSTRSILLGLFAICTGLLSFGLYLQHVVGLEPCPMCIMQRYAFVMVGLVALAGGLHGPKRIGSKVYAGIILLFAVLGGGVAARQTWLQISPPDIPECGPGLEYMVESFGLGEALPMIFRGAGDCAAIDWTFLGLSIANWSLVCFTAVAVLAVALLLRRGPLR